MATVTYRNMTFECYRAYQGDDYVHLVDEDGKMIAAFDGVTDFSEFTLTGDDGWYSCSAYYSPFAVVLSDGTIGKSNYYGYSFPTSYETWTFTLDDGSTVTKKVVVK